MRKILLILGFTILFSCSKDDDDNPKEDSNTLKCGSLIITKIDEKPNKVMLKAYGSEGYEVALPDGKTFKDVTCDKTLEWFGIEAN